MRLDKALVERALVSTRSQAKVAIEQGLVCVNGVIASKTSQKVSQEDTLIIEEDLYVSRGAYKLLKAIDVFNLKLDGLVGADIGASTGGFTQVALESGAQKMYCIDVGKDQLAKNIKNDSRVVNFESTNIRDGTNLGEKVDFFVCDVSFISLKLIFEQMISLLKPSGFGVVLVKPQFEAGKNRIGKSGLVNESDRVEIVAEMKAWFESQSYNISGWIESPIKGHKSGNTEYLVYYSKEKSGN